MNEKNHSLGEMEIQKETEDLQHKLPDTEPFPISPEYRHIENPPAKTIPPLSSPEIPRIDPESVSTDEIRNLEEDITATYETPIQEPDSISPNQPIESANLPPQPLAKPRPELNDSDQQTDKLDEDNTSHAYRKIKNNFAIEGDYLISIGSFVWPMEPDEPETDKWVNTKEIPLFLRTDKDGQEQTYLSTASFDLLLSNRKKDSTQKTILLEEIARRAHLGEFTPNMAQAIKELTEYGNLYKTGVPKSGSGNTQEDPCVIKKEIQSAFSIFSPKKSKLLSHSERSVRLSSKKKDNYFDMDIIDEEGNLTYNAWSVIRHGFRNYSNIWAQVLGPIRLTKDKKWMRDYLPSQALILDDYPELLQAIINMIANNGKTQQVAAGISSLIENWEFLKEHGSDEANMKRSCQRQPDGKLIEINNIEGVSQTVNVNADRVEISPTTLVGRMDQQIESPTQIEVSTDEIKKYITDLRFAMGANIDKLNISFDDECKIDGNVKIPVAFVGGNVTFSLSIKNGPDGRLSAKILNMQASNPFLEGKLSDVSPIFQKLDSTILNQINSNLKRNQATSMSVGEQNFLFQVAPRFK